MPMRRGWRMLELVALPALAMATAFWMVIDYLADPFEPSLSGISAYGHNHQGALIQGLVLTAIEFAAVSLILRPWSRPPSWRRAASALALFLPWTAFSLFLTMHAGGVMTVHFLWLTTVVLIVSGYLIRSAVLSAAVQLRRR